MLNRMTISQKGLLLLSVPILFEIVLVGILLAIMLPMQDSLQQSSQFMAKTNALKQILNDIGQINSEMLRRMNFATAITAAHYEVEFRKGDALAFEAFKKSAEANIDDMFAKDPQALLMMNSKEFKRWTKSAQEHISDYYKASFGKDQNKEQHSPYGDKLNTILALVVQAQKSAGSGQPKEASLLSARAYKQLMDMCVAADSEFLRVSQQENQIRKEMLGMDEARLKATSQQITMVLLAGVLINIVLAIVLAAVFSKTASGRLLFLMDNTKRLVEGSSLNPALTGSDELAVLDNSFHDMANRLENSRRKEQAIIQNASEVLCSLDRDWNFVDANPAAQKILGVNPEDLRGRSLEQFLSQSDWKSTKDCLLEARANNNAINFENELIIESGAKIPMLWSVRWNEEQGKVFCLARDITERKQLEKMRQEFVTMVSSDLRTPLSHLDSFLGKLTEGGFGNLNKDGSEQARKSMRNNKRLLELVNDLLNLDKLSSGQMDLKITECAAQDLSQRSIDAVAGFASKVGIKLVNRADDLTLDCDGDRVVQVLVNLIGNSVKFSPKGSEIICSAVPDTDKMIKFSVQDFGRGIPEAMCKSVFEKFKQVAKADATEKGGSGLGLAICKTIVECHGGEIGVDSELGKGSTFWFRIPQRQKV